MRRSGWRSAENFSYKMEWQHAIEEELLTWTVKAVDRNILSWACVFIPGTISFIIYAGYTWAAGDVVTAKTVLASLVLPLFIAYKVVMEKTVFVYRATGGVEICQWQDIPDLLFTFLRMFPFFVAGIVLMALVSNPALSIAALAGPALVGVLVASLGGDSNYKSVYKRFRQWDFKWKDIDRALLDRRKGLIALSISSDEDYIHDHEIDFEDPSHHRYLTPIYFDKRQERAVLELFKRHMPSCATTVERNFKYAFGE